MFRVPNLLTFYQVHLILKNLYKVEVGRVLRLSENKKAAYIFDFIVVPEITITNIDEDININILKEMPRFAEFSSEAINEYEARSVIMPILSLYNLEYLANIKPWDLYNKYKNDLILMDEKKELIIKKQLESLDNDVKRLGILAIDLALKYSEDSIVSQLNFHIQKIIDEEKLDDNI